MGTSINCLIDNLGSPEPLESHCHSQQDLYFSRCPNVTGMLLILFSQSLEAISSEFIRAYKRLSDFNLMLLQEDMMFSQELHGDML